MKCLYANGDSWTYGEEIVDGSSDNLTVKYYNTWPFFLSQHLDISICVNEALGGGNNERIVRKTLDFIFKWVKDEKNPSDLLVVIGWTSPERCDVGFKGVDGKIVHSSVTPSDILNYVPKNTSNENLEQLKIFKKSFYSLIEEEDMIDKHFKQMLQLRLTCKALGIHYYDFFAFSVGYLTHLKKIKDLGFEEHWKNFNSDFSFRDLLFKEGWGVLQYGHPSINAHKKWSEILAEKIRAL